MQSAIGKAQHIHLLGAGGAGVSAVGRWLVALGKEVTGSDRESSRATEDLISIGAKIEVGSATMIPPKTELVIYTNALPPDHTELIEAGRRRLPTLSYPEALGELARTLKVVAVSGTHGKTTTTAMVAEIMLKASLDPTVLVGGNLIEWKTNFIKGGGEYLVVEADEYRRSFLNLWPEILIITNIDRDHLDYYRDLADIQSAFGELASRVPETGAIICPATQPKLAPVLQLAKGRVVNYPEIDLSGLVLSLPGTHNVANASAAVAAAEALGIEKGKAINTLNHFKGVERRFEYKGQMLTGATVYNDYAHNPDKVHSLLKGAREMFPRRRIIIVFQPHLYSRTKLLFNELAQSLALADRVITLPIYAAREEIDNTINSGDLAQAVKEKGTSAIDLKTFSAVADHLQSFSREGDIVLLVGAGDIFRLSDLLL